MASKKSGPTRFQRIEHAVVARTAIKGAPYNPRQIDAHAMKKIRENIQKVGLLTPILVNRKSMTVVSGHQRLAALDALEGSSNYELQISYCELTPKQEREQNIFMNNESAMGSWDLDALADMIGTDNIDIHLAGFENAELKMMLPEWNPQEILRDLPKSAEESESEDLAASVAEVKAAKKKSLERARALDDTEFFISLVFRDRAHLDGYLDTLKIDRREKHFAPEKYESAVRDLIAREKTNGTEAATSNKRRKA